MKNMKFWKEGFSPSKQRFERLTSCGASLSDISHWILVFTGEVFWLNWRSNDRATLSAVTVEHVEFGDRKKSMFEYNELMDENLDKQSVSSLSKSKSSVSSVVDRLDAVDVRDDVNELIV